MYSILFCTCHTASEYRSWTLFYAIPVLRGVLSDRHFQHFLLFSEALWLLLQSAPSLEDVTKAERLLQHFCMKFAAYYGKDLQVLSLCVLALFTKYFNVQVKGTTRPTSTICCILQILSVTLVLFGNILLFHSRTQIDGLAICFMAPEIHKNKCVWVCGCVCV